MKINLIKTRNGNIFCSLNEKFGFFTQDFVFLRLSDKEEWENAVSKWKNIEVMEKELCYDIFPKVVWIKDLVFYFFPKGHPKKGVLRRMKRTLEEGLDGNEEVFSKISFHESISLRGGLNILSQRRKDRTERTKRKAFSWMQTYPISLYEITPSEEYAGCDTRWGSNYDIVGLRHFVVFGNHELDEDCFPFGERDYEYYLLEYKGDKKILYSNGTAGNPDYFLGFKEVQGFIRGKSFENKTVEILDSKGGILIREFFLEEKEENFPYYPDFFSLVK